MLFRSGKIFGSGSRTPIAITILVNNPKKDKKKAKIYYHDIGDYLTREQKLEMVKKFRSVNGVEWKTLEPNEKNDWINVRDGVFDSLIIIGDKTNKENRKTFFSPQYARGIGTSRDDWAYNFSQTKMLKSMKNTLEFFNLQCDGYLDALKQNKDIKVEDFIDTDDTKISWSRDYRYRVSKNKKFVYDKNSASIGLYRPY